MQKVLHADELACAIQLLWLTANPSYCSPNVVQSPAPVNFPSSSSTSFSSSSDGTTIRSSAATGIPIIVRADCAYQQRHLHNAFRKRPRWCIINTDHDDNDTSVTTTTNHTSGNGFATIVNTDKYDNILIQINEYESIEWDNVMNQPYIITNNFCVRKGLGRKAGLAKALTNHIQRCNSSLACPIRTALPRTLIIDSTGIFFNRPVWLDYRSAVAECLYEIDDMMTEAFEKYETRKSKDPNVLPPLWILKPSITNKGADIHIVRNLDEVRYYITSLPELGQWVVQEYVTNPLLLPLPLVVSPSSHPNPSTSVAPGLSTTEVDAGHKFHLRVYVVAVGALSVFVYPETLVLIAPQVYDTKDIDNTGAHITNTCVGVGDNAFTESLHVRCLSELSSILYHGSTVTKQKKKNGINTLEEANRIVQKIYKDICSIVAHTFAAMEGDVGGYMPIPRCYELYGVDFLVTDDSSEYTGSTDDPYTVKLLEYNPSPDIKQTGNRLDYIIENMIDGVVSLTLDQRITFTDSDSTQTKKDDNDRTVSGSSTTAAAIPQPSTIPSDTSSMGDHGSSSWSINVLPYGTLTDSTRETTYPSIKFSHTNGILHEPVRDEKSGWDCVYSKYWAPAHAQMNVRVE